MPQGVGYGMGERIDGDPFPNMVRDRDQLSQLWTHIAEVLSDGVRQKAMQEQAGPVELPDPSQWAGADARLREDPGMMDLPAGGLPPQSADPGASRSGGRMSGEDIGQVAFNAGFRGQALITMIAIAMAESSGNPRAHNPVGRDNSYGLWQINMLDTATMKMGEERRRKYGIQNEDLWDPAVNARVAFDLSRGGTRFTDWSVYNDGKYLRFWEAASRAAAGISQPNIEGMR